jgi:hypothetical protein
MECIRQLLLRSGEALFLLQLLSQHHVTRLIQGFDANLQQALVQLTFHQLVCSDEGDCLATRLISALMEVKLFGQSMKEILSTQVFMSMEIHYFILNSFLVHINFA